MATLRCARHRHEVGTLPSALNAALAALGRAAMVVDEGGDVLEANGAARSLLHVSGRSLLDELDAAASSGTEHEGWSYTAVLLADGRRAFLFVQCPAFAGREPSVPVAAAASHWGLTSRQQEILAAVVDGKPNRAIAALLGIAERTVEAHLTAIFEKSRVDSRAALVGRVFTLA
jgi:DNA-binding NarL/FixJ family response regulator